MAQSYMRYTEVLAGGVKLDSNSLDIGFSIPFDDGEEANVGTVTIYNLSDGTINNIKQSGYLVLNSGYVGNVGSVMVGSIKSVTTEHQEVDKITTITVVDTVDGWADTPVKKTYAEGAKASDILRDLSTITGVQFGAISLVNDFVYIGGLTVNGTFRTVLKKISGDSGSKIHMNKGKLFIRPSNEGDQTGFILNAETGLMSSPAAFEREETPKGLDKKVKVNGWEVECLLNHQITTDAILSIASRTANGYFRVKKGEHVSGDNDHYTRMEVYPI